jgi:hypothetical protein
MKYKNFYIVIFLLIFMLLISGCSSILFGPSGSIEVNTNPSGAKIFLDGKDTGKTSPCLLKNVSSGTHVVEAIYFNKKYAEMVDVKGYKGTEIDIDFDYKFELVKINVLPSITNITLSLGNTTNINSITGFYSDNSSKNIPVTSCTYSSSNKTYANVSNNGTITGLSAGASVITVSYTENGIIKTDTVLVYIRNTPEDNPIEPTPIEPEPEPEPEPSLNVLVTLDNAEQEYYEYLEHWSMVRAYYTISNNSDITINDYRIFFSVESIDGSIYYDSWYDGYNLSPGQSRSDYALLYTYDKQVKLNTVKVIEVQVNVFN